MSRLNSEPSYARRLVHRFVPAHFRDPIGLTKRLIATRDPAALFAITAALLGMAATPFDLLLSPLERRKYDSAPPSSLPQIFVCGGPRTGTTCAVQFLAQHFPFSYFTNLSSLFPRSPITAQKLVPGVMKLNRQPAHNFYGRTTGFSGMNDALYVWDRWLGEDRQHPHFEINAETAEEMQQFFAAWEAAFPRALLAKCNSLNSIAHLIADILENSYFICITREPRYMAQSLYQARLLINGTIAKPYGLVSPETSDLDDPISSICKQILYHQNLANTQAERLGSERFFVTSYEELCSKPEVLLNHVGCKILGLSEPKIKDLELSAIYNRNEDRLDPALLQEIDHRLEELSNN